jgi:Skp family chaperone for outer membrane proteins
MPSVLRVNTANKRRAMESGWSPPTRARQRPLTHAGMPGEDTASIVMERIMQIKSIWSVPATAFAVLLMIPTLSQAGAADAPATEPAAGSQRIAVFDLDKAARDLGYMSLLQTNLDACRKQLQADVKKFAQAYETQVQSVARSMVPKDAKPTDRYTLTPAQSAEVNRDVAAVRQQVAQLNQKAEQAFNGYRAEWIRHYREALAPIVQQVARSRKASVVLVRNDTVMYAEPATDITDAVVAAARATPPEVAPVPMAHVEAPAEVSFPGAPATQPAAATP